MRQYPIGQHAHLLIALALILLYANDALAQWGQQVPPQLLVEFRLTLTPDREATSLGAVPLSNQVGMAGRLWQDRFTGSGCTPRSFEPSLVNLRSLSGGAGHPFDVSCRSRSNDDKVSLIEWKGNLENGKMSGDVWITLPGTPLTAEQITARVKVDREQTRKSQERTIDGLVVNEAEVEHALSEIDAKNALLPAQGRRLHYTFTTAEVVIIPVGTWSDLKQSTTRPNTTEPAGQQAVRLRG